LVPERPADAGAERGFTMTRSYDGSYSNSITDTRDVSRHGYADVGANIFIWIAWVVAFAFWAFSMQTAVGIIQDIAETPASVVGNVDLAGIGFAIMTIGAVVVLGLAIAWGAERWATRDKSLDPLTEAATARLYDEAGRPRA
jgi:hypothetical protein